LVEFEYINNEDLDIIFDGIKCDINSMHDTFVRIGHGNRLEDISHIKFSYLKQYEDAVSVIKNYSVKLPLTGKDLYYWSVELRNCLSSYSLNIRSGSSIIYGFYKSGVLDFAVEIGDNKIVEARQKYNENLTIEQNTILNIWYKRYFTKNKIKKEDSNESTTN